MCDFSIENRKPMVSHIILLALIMSIIVIALLVSHSLRLTKLENIEKNTPISLNDITTMYEEIEAVRLSCNPLSIESKEAKIVKQFSNGMCISEAKIINISKGDIKGSLCITAALPGDYHIHFYIPNVTGSDINGASLLDIAKDQFISINGKVNAVSIRELMSIIWFGKNTKMNILK